MSWFGYTPLGMAYDAIQGNKNEVLGDMGAPSRSGGEYAGVDRSNYDLPGFQQRNDQLNAYAQQYASDPFRAQQQQLASQLMAQAQGSNPLSAEQLRQNTQRLQGQQMSMAAGARPANQAMASRLAMQNASQLGASMSGQQALAGIAERNAATQALGGVLQGGRGLDQSGYLGAMGMGLQNAGMQQAGGMGYESNRAGRFGAMLGVPTQGEKWMGLAQSGLQGAAMMSDVRLKQGVQPIGPPDWTAGLPTTQADWAKIDAQNARRGSSGYRNNFSPAYRGLEAGLVDEPDLRGGLLLSDEREKQKAFQLGVSAARGAGGMAAGASQPMERFLGTAAKPYEYEYRARTGLPPGRRAGVMAQNVEQVAPDAVLNTPGGKMVDFAKLGPPMMAGLGYLNRKVDALKGALGGNGPAMSGDNMANLAAQNYMDLRKRGFSRDDAQRAVKEQYPAFEAAPKTYR